MQKVIMSEVFGKRTTLIKGSAAAGKMALMYGLATMFQSTSGFISSEIPLANVPSNTFDHIVEVKHLSNEMQVFIVSLIEMANRDIKNVFIDCMFVHTGQCPKKNLETLDKIAQAFDINLYIGLQLPYSITQKTFPFLRQHG